MPPSTPSLEGVVFSLKPMDKIIDLKDYKKKKEVEGEVLSYSIKIVHTIYPDDEAANAEIFVEGIQQNPETARFIADNLRAVADSMDRNITD